MTENELIRQLQHHIDQPEVFDPPPRNWRLLCRESIEAIQRLRGNKPHESETNASSPAPAAEDFWEKHWFAIGDCVRVVSQNCDLNGMVRRGKWLQQELSQRGFQLIVAEPPAEKANDPLAQLEDDATFGEIVEEIQAKRDGKGKSEQP